MRLLIRLEAARDQKYKTDYHYNIHGFIYNLLKDSEFAHIHNKKGYKFFCFSNIFPISDMKKGDIKQLLISSPNSKFVKSLAYKLKIIKRSSSVINIGDMKFLVRGYKVFNNRLDKENLKLITATPIIIRINKDRYKEFGINPRYEYDYLYWRKEYPLELFINQLEDNLYKKYEEYNSLKLERERIINKLRFIKQVSTRLKIHNNEHIVIGTLWEFWFDNINDNIIKLLKFGYDCGFGERNSLGFGFINRLC
ncbi:MAG: CRISPR-associated protein Cas6 [Candidatus Nitrosocaldaceae archaeon]|nr:MAG: CRISPR-associated protein Cas6 [Candidatus Nitrosocaldaceae archaeon]